MKIAFLMSTVISSILAFNVGCSSSEKRAEPSFAALQIGASSSREPSSAKAYLRVEPAPTHVLISNSELRNIFKSTRSDGSGYNATLHAVGTDFDPSKAQVSLGQGAALVELNLLSFPDGHYLLVAGFDHENSRFLFEIKDKNVVSSKSIQLGKLRDGDLRIPKYKIMMVNQ